MKRILSLRIWAIPLFALCVLVVFAPRATAQFVPPAPTPNDTLVSPRVLSGHRVLFQIYAPKASEVAMRGDWMEGPGMTQLAKDSLGVWSVTVGPLRPDTYSYAFAVDGVRTLDPKNVTIKQGTRSLDNMFFLPGEEAAYQEHRPVPHGQIRQVWYDSSTLGMQRRMHVYTPPNYDLDETDYPVFYLLHGGGDDDSGWSTIGRAGLILDNLLAEEKAVPMLIVMPNGSLPPPSNPPAGGAGSPERRAFMEAAQARFTNDLMEDVIPTVETLFRVRPTPADRALAGLSMGGGQTLRVLTEHWNQFAYVGIWSAGMLGQNAEDFKTRNASFLSDPDEVNRWIKRLEIVCGDNDFLFESSRALSTVFTEAGISHEMVITGGGHTWINWRMYLRDLSERLFR